MTTKQLFLLVAAGLLASAGQSHAGKFYKWVDSDGVTHYTQSPPPEGTEGEEVKTRNTTSSDAEQARESLQNERAAQLKQLQEADKKAAEAPQEESKPEDKSEFLERCKQHRENLQALRERAQLRTEDPETGELVPLDDEGRDALIKQTEDALKGCP
ncbi:MAG: DUF4124 domain-containing protein [Alcanivoracaceae bacterium]|nr:DUF4124 domain-containing protein [Alcanivoracaceae bacterium]